MAIGDFCTNNTDCGLGEFCDNAGFCQASFGDSPPPPPSESTGNCWKITNSTIGFSADVQYVNLSNQTTITTIPTGDTVYICAKTTPEVIPNLFGVQLDVRRENLEKTCTANSQCTPTTPDPTPTTATCRLVSNSSFENKVVFYRLPNTTTNSSIIIEPRGTVSLCSAITPFATDGASVLDPTITSQNTGTTCTDNSNCGTAPPRESGNCYTVTNNNTEDVNVQYAEVGRTGTSIKLVLRGETVNLCSKVKPSTLATLNPAVAENVIISGAGTVCESNATCESSPPPPPPPPQVCKLWRIETVGRTGTGTLPLTVSYTDCSTRTATSTNRTFVESTALTNIFQGSSLFVGTVCSTTEPSFVKNTLTNIEPDIQRIALTITPVKENPTTEECSAPPSPTNYTVTLGVETIINGTSQTNSVGGTISLAQITNETVGNYVSTSPQTFANGTNLSVRATANTGYRFKNWKETTSTTTNPRTFTLSGNVTITAVFEPVDSGGGGGGEQWRNCLTGALTEGTAPSGWIQKQYSGGGVCYEPPDGTITFQPTLSEALRFVHTRGETYPSPVTIRAVNPSTTYSYKVTLIPGDTKFLFSPSTFTVAPNQQFPFTAVPTPELINALADGTAEIALSVTIERI